MCCCNLFVKILLKIFESMFIMDIGLKFSFFLLSLCQVLVSGWCWSHKMIWEGFPSFVLFGIVSEGMVPAPLCMSGRMQLWTHLDLDFFWLVGYKLLPQLQPLFLVYSRFQFLPDLGLGRVQLSMNLSSSPNLLVCVHRIIVISDGSLYFCGITKMISPLSFFIASIWFFSLFFFINLASSLSVLLIFSKN